MPDNVKIKTDDEQRFSGRLVGFISDQECTALMNTKDAARKVSTEKTLDGYEMPTVVSNKRFVVVTSNYSGDGGIHKAKKVIFISPKIKFSSYTNATSRKIHCSGDHVYEIDFV